MVGATAAVAQCIRLTSAARGCLLVVRRQRRLPGPMGVRMGTVNSHTPGATSQACKRAYSIFPRKALAQAPPARCPWGAWHGPKGGDVVLTIPAPLFVTRVVSHHG